MQSKFEIRKSKIFLALILILSLPLFADESPDTKVSIAGTLRTEDGKPLPHPQNIHLDISSSLPNSRTHGTIDIDKFGNFKDSWPTGDILISVKVSGYAPLFAGPLTPNADNALDPIDLVLDKGFPATIRLNDPDDKPIPSAKAVLSYQRDEATYFCCPETFTTDATGTIVVPNAIDRAAQVEVDAPGFQYDILTLVPDRDAPAILQLKPATPSAGTIIDSNNKPVAKATIALLERKDSQATHFYNPGDSKPPSFVLATTDASGRFSLASLRDDSTYALLISAPGCATQLLDQVKAGDNNLDLTLAPAKPIELEIHVASGETFPKNLEVFSVFHRQNSANHSLHRRLPIKVQDGVGHLTLDDPLPAPYTFRDTAGHSVTVDPTDFTNPIVFDLAAEPAP